MGSGPWSIYGHLLTMQPGKLFSLPVPRLPAAVEIEAPASLRG